MHFPADYADNEFVTGNKLAPRQKTAEIIT